MILRNGNSNKINLTNVFRKNKYAVPWGKSIEVKCEKVLLGFLQDLAINFREKDGGNPTAQWHACS